MTSKKYKKIQSRKTFKTVIVIHTDALDLNIKM